MLWHARYLDTYMEKYFQPIAYFDAQDIQKQVLVKKNIAFTASIHDSIKIKTIEDSGEHHRALVACPRRRLLQVPEGFSQM